MRSLMGSATGLVLAASLLLSACQPAGQQKYASLGDTPTRSILVVPVINTSTEVNAPDGLLVTLAPPIVERGYYVFPTHMVRRTMEDDGLGDADLVHGADTVKLARLFGADAVLYAAIQDWSAKYIILSTQTSVAIDYTLKSGATGETLWTNHQRHVFTAGPQGGGLGGLLAGAIAAAVERAAPSYLPLASQASRGAVAAPGRGLPPGPYYRPRQ
jgi:hypothetical protein